MLTRPQAMGEDVRNVEKLEDRPQMLAQQLKATFDKAGVDLKQAHNALVGCIEELVRQLEGAQGAGEIGAKALGQGDGSAGNVQAKLEYLLGQIGQMAAGDIPDGSLGEEKLSFVPEYRYRRQRFVGGGTVTLGAEDAGKDIICSGQAIIVLGEAGQITPGYRVRIQAPQAQTVSVREAGVERVRLGPLENVEALCDGIRWYYSPSVSWENVRGVPQGLLQKAAQFDQLLLRSAWRAGSGIYAGEQIYLITNADIRAGDMVLCQALSSAGQGLQGVSAENGQMVLRAQSVPTADCSVRFFVLRTLS